MDSHAFESLDKLQRQDHDSLIRLESKFDNFLTSYTQDIKDLKDGTTKQLADHEIRLRSIEKMIETFKPEERVKQLDSLLQDRNDSKVRRRTIMAIVAVIASVVSTILTILLQKFL